jgi:uncharacterized protein
MSALPSPLQNQSGAGNASVDPSMEEILASIRRIIADDHGTPINPRPSRAAAAPVAADVTPVVSPKPILASRAEPPRLRPSLDATELRAPQPEARASTAPPISLAESLDSGVVERLARLEPSPARVRPAFRPMFDESTPPQAEAAQAPVTAKEEESAPVAPSRAAVSEESLLSPLARASVSSAFEALTVSMAVQNSSMIEEAVRDMLRPMLKQWLDENLPTVVERLVRAEIERVARGGRS